MFVPPMYRTPDDMITDVVTSHPLALFITNGDGVPFATHLPIVPESPDPIAVGSTLFGHLNRANPHWSALSDGIGARLVFTGPNGYVTPTTYATSPAAPTWNFVSVHISGSVELFDGIDATIDVVTATVHAYEKRFGTGWAPDESIEYFRRIGPAVGAFRFRVTAIDGQHKLSQDKAADVRARVADRFADSDTGVERDLGALMRKFEEETQK